MEQVTYCKLNLKKNQGHLPKTAEEDLPTVLYADIRRGGSKSHLSAEDPVPEGPKENVIRCSYKTLSGVLVLIIVVLSCALGYIGYMVYYPIHNRDELHKELCVNSSKSSSEILQKEEWRHLTRTVQNIEAESGCHLCPPYWLQHGDHCYYYSDVTDRTWNQSRDHCKEMGADLLVIKDREQQMFIQKDPYWIGLHRDGDVWRWVDEREYNSSLFKTEPNPSEHCVYMSESHYHPGTCNSTKKWICVKKAVRL